MAQIGRNARPKLPDPSASPFGPRLWRSNGAKTWITTSKMNPWHSHPMPSVVFREGTLEEYLARGNAFILQRSEEHKRRERQSQKPEERDVTAPAEPVGKPPDREYLTQGQCRKEHSESLIPSEEPKIVLPKCLNLLIHNSAREP